MCYADLDHFKEFNDATPTTTAFASLRILGEDLHAVVKGLCGEQGFADTSEGRLI